MEIAFDRSRRSPLQNGQRFAIGQPGDAPNHGGGKSIRFHPAGPIKLHKNRLGQMILVRPQAANHVRQSLRQHRQHAVRKINAIAPTQRFAIQRRARLNVMRDIRDMNPDAPSAALRIRHMNGVIKVPGIVRIDREYRRRSQILTSAQFILRNIERYLVRLFQNRIRKSDWKIMLPNDRQDIDPWLLRRTKDLDDGAFRIEVSMFPRVHLDHHLVVHLRHARHLTGRRGHINVVHQSRFIRHHVIEILRALQRPDDGLVRSAPGS